MVKTSDGGYAMAGITVVGTGIDYKGHLVKIELGSGLTWTDSAANTITLYRGATDPYWNFVRVCIWKPKTP
jgi:hypothetical protein